MAKTNTQPTHEPKLATSEQDACEIIELAVEDVQVLARAFDLIADVCAGLAEKEHDKVDEEVSAPYLVH